MKLRFLLLFMIYYSGLIAQPAVSDTVPDFTVIDVHGNMHHLYSYLEEGKYVGIDFFGTTCEQCIELVPVLSNIYTSYGCNRSNFVLLAINLLYHDGDVMQFEQDYGGNYPAISGVEGGGANVYYDWEIQFWPQFVLISPNKTLIANINPISLLSIDSTLNHHGIEKDSCDANGFSETRLINELSIYPNPAKNIIKIKNSYETLSNYHYIICNLTGQSLLVGRAECQIDVSTLSSGIYFLELSNDKCSCKRKILID